MKNIQEPYARSDWIMFYPWGLGGKDEIIDKGWIMKTLGTIMRELEHENVTLDSITN
jgi:hypothetical protein